MARHARMIAGVLAPLALAAAAFLTGCDHDLSAWEIVDAATAVADTTDARLRITYPLLARQGRTDEAVTEFRTAIDLDPKYVPACNNLAEALVKQGKLEDAEYYYRRSLAEKPSPAVQSALDVVLRKRGEADEARPAIAQAQASASHR